MSRTPLAKEAASGMQLVRISQERVVLALLDAVGQVRHTNAAENGEMIDQRGRSFVSSVDADFEDTHAILDERSQRHMPADAGASAIRAVGDEERGAESMRQRSVGGGNDGLAAVLSVTALCG